MDEELNKDIEELFKLNGVIKNLVNAIATIYLGFIEYGLEKDVAMELTKTWITMTLDTIERK